MEGSIAFGSSISSILSSNVASGDRLRSGPPTQLPISDHRRSGPRPYLGQSSLHGSHRRSGPRPYLGQSSLHGSHCSTCKKGAVFSCKEHQADSMDGSMEFSLQTVVSEPATQWKECEGGVIQDEEIAKQEISIRRHPLTGPSSGKQSDIDTPRDILEEIVWSKDAEVAQMKEKMPFESVRQALQYAPPPKDFIAALKARAEETGLPALIAEVKKASPSRGVIQPNFDPVQIAHAYEKGGAACLSVLTDSKYFQGSFENLQAIRESGIQCPLLCKEFVIDAYQLYYARLKGADAVLLIASVLSDQEIKYLKLICKNLGMAALVEVHSVGELDRVLGIDGIELIGINNRDLGTFQVDIHNTEQLLQGDRIQTIRDRKIIVVGESGLFTPDDIALVQKAGVRAVLVGESIVKQSNPAAGIARLFGTDISRQRGMQTTVA